MLEEITLKAAGRDLRMCGTEPRYLRSFNGWDADVSCIYASAKEIPFGATVIDVGANIGILACSLAVQRPDLTVIAIEPVPPNVECLRRNVAANGLKNVDVIHAAVSDKSGRVRVNVNGPWSVVMEHGEAEVPAVTLDEFSSRNVGLVKIDVEGWEPYVLAGGRALMAALRPRVLMEWNTGSLMLKHHDPINFANAVWSAFDVIETFFEDNPEGIAPSGTDIVMTNITKHRSVTDILMVPKANFSLPSLESMIHSPAYLKFMQERIDAKG